ncbi:MAG TPA: aminotransferase class I/II-fold pyridoxal phosphate-dependent enzyme [Spirochaetales bacterium]|nr:aminotransferase class I/II-fold pyridoxal phosphate-dependent enzyme [Spirochaetales bacterium]HRY55851.1 aminotransferase class I/II-fold pyridoxal phosphate-dependent enzyme [Spirochaetia bacterium]HRZ65733.1 aminotransferase class I/II-fold pyridoxal phosphate-dependent enzyme [Spirochaetia bacterium]
MQALILAAGMGKRLGALTKEATKCMVEVCGKKLIDSALEAVVEAGIKDVTIVVGYKGENLRKYLESASYPGLRFRFVDNPIYDKTNNIYSLWLAREALASDDTILIESDLIFEKGLLRDLVQSKEPNAAVVARWKSWMDGTVTLLDSEGFVRSVIDKKDFKWKRIGEYYKTVNIYKLSREFSAKYYLPFMEAHLASFGRNNYYEQVLKVLSFVDGPKIKGFKIKKRRWYEIDDPQDLDIAETLFAADADRLERFQSRYGGYWRFPFLKDFCYLVNPYYPPKTMLREMRSSFEVLLSQYPSGARVLGILAGKTFGLDPSRVAVGNGAAELIRHLFELVPGEVGVVYPAFNEYPARAGAGRVRKILADPESLGYGLPELLPALPGLGALVVVNPDNPSGHFIEKAEMLSLVAACRDAGVVLVVDESFADFAEERLRYTLLDDELLAANPHLVAVKSISKSYGVPGLRLGVLASSRPGLVESLRKTLPVWNINSFGEFFLQIADKYKSDYRQACNRLALERGKLAAGLAAIRFLEPLGSQANYLSCRVKPPFASGEVCARLLQDHGILAKDLRGKEGLRGDWMRFAVRDEEDNAALVMALAAIEKEGPRD